MPRADRMQKLPTSPRLLTPHFRSLTFATWLVCASAVASLTPARAHAETGAPAPTTALPDDLFDAPDAVSLPVEVLEGASHNDVAPVDEQLQNALLVRESTANELEELTRSIETTLRSPTVRGHVIGAYIQALSSGQVVYENNADHLLKPASNTKVLTTAAAFAILGTQWRTESRVVVNAPPVDGVVRGDLVLQGLFDLSWSTLFYPTKDFVANRLIDQLVERGIREIQGDVQIRGVFVYDGQRFGTLNTHAERLQVAEAIRERLRVRGIRHGGNFQVHAEAPSDDYNIELASWKGPTLSSIIAHVNRMSHNEFADTLMLAIGRHARNSATYGDGFQAAKAWFDSVGVNTSGMVLHDGSGLSHNNRVTAHQLAQLVAAIQTQPWADDWNHSLSVAGLDGTYSFRCRSENTIGAAWLKSGTINGVISTTGILHHRGTGEVYALSLIMNEVVHQPSARLALDQIVEALGASRAASGRPGTVTLQHAKLTDTEDVELAWTNEPSATAYVVEERNASTGWRVIANVTDTRYQFPRQAQPHAWRVRAVNANGVSDPSGVLIAGGPRVAPKVTVVDGNDRWASDQAENGLKTPPWFLVELLEPLTGYRVESINNDDIAALRPAGDTTVVFALGEESRATEALSERERQFIRAQIQAGGRVIAAGSELGWDLATNVADGPAFLDEVFGAAFEADDAGNTAACTDTQRGAVCPHFWTPGMMKISMPDSFVPTRGDSCMSYAGMSTSACMHYQGAAIVGFPLESIDNTEDRTRIVRHLLEQVGTPRTSDRT